MYKLIAKKLLLEGIMIRYKYIEKRIKILVILLILLISFVEGCVNKSSSSIQTVGENGTAILDGKHSSTVIIKQGEKLYYVEGCGSNAFCDSRNHVGDGIAEFAKSHNVTRIEIQYENDVASGAYVVYKD